MRSARPAPPTPRAYARADSTPGGCVYACVPRRTCRKEASMLEVLHDLLDDIPNPAHKLLFIAFNTGPSIPRARLLRTVSGLPNPTRHFIFQFSGPYGPLLLRLAPLGTTVGTSPRCCTPIKISFRLLFRREPMFVFVFEESLFAFDIETPPFGFALLLPR